MAVERDKALEMAVSGTNQPNTYAVADVIKLTPLVPVPPVLQQPTLAGTTFTAFATTQFGLDYTLEYQEPTGASPWTPVQTVPGNGSQLLLADPSATSTTRFYRLRAQWH